MTPAEFALLGIDPSTVGSVMMWGFGFVVTQYFLGWTIGVGIDTIRKV
jgi:hypothetical protein